MHLNFSPSNLSPYNDENNDNNELWHHLVPDYYPAIPGPSRQNHSPANGVGKDASNQPDMKLHGKIKERLFTVIFQIHTI